MQRLITMAAITVGIAGLLAIHAGCATSAEKKRFGSDGFGPNGFVRDNGRGEAEFKGNKFTSKKKVERVCLQYAAQLCRDEGFEYFMITKDTGVQEFSYERKVKGADVPRNNSEFTGRQRPIVTETGLVRKIQFMAYKRLSESVGPKDYITVRDVIGK